MNWYRILSYAAVPVWIFLSVEAFRGNLPPDFIVGVVFATIAISNLADGLRGRRAV